MKRIIISTDSVNCYKYRLLSQGCDTSLYSKNSILLYMHERGNIIGKLTNVQIEQCQITGVPVFADTQKGRECQYLYEHDMLNMASVWAEPLEWSKDPELMLEGQELPTVTKWLLKEVSLVDIAGNDDAVKLVDAHNNEFKLSYFNNPDTFKINSNMKNVVSFLKLTEGADEAAVLVSVKQLAADKESLVQRLAAKEKELQTAIADKTAIETKLSEVTKVEFTALLNDPKRKLTAEQKEVYNTLYSANPEAATKAVKALPVTGKLADIPDPDNTDNDLYKDFTFDDFQLKAPDALADIKQNNRERYTKLFKAKYGKEPSNFNK